MDTVSSSEMNTSSKSKAKMPTSFVIPSDELLVYGSKTASKSANKTFKKEASRSNAKKEDKSPSTTATKDLEPISLFPAEVLVSAMASRRAEFEKEAQKKIIVKKLSWPNPQNSYSSVPLTELKPLTFSMMKLGKRLLGYLLCRIISPAARQVCVQLVVEDVEGNAQFISVYHHPGTLEASPSELDTLFPLGMMLVIKNPYVKRADNGSPFTHLRIDVPTAVIPVECSSEILSLDGVVWKTGERPDPLISKTAEEWKAIGDSHFKARQFFVATIAYSRSLKLDPSNYKVRMNRSLAHLRLENTEACLEDIEQLLQDTELPHEDRLKSILRKGLARYAEARYQDAKEAFSECLKLDSASSATQYLDQCNARLRESSTGEYDWATLYKKAKIPGSRLDVAPFRGPVELKSADNLKGQAVYASEAINMGQLLVVEKAFACSFLEDLGRDYHNIHSEYEAWSTQLVHLRQACIDKLAYNPRLHSLFFQQWAGNPKMPLYYNWAKLPSKDRVAEAEIFSLPRPPSVPQIHRIAAINSFLTWFPGEVTFNAIYKPRRLGAAIFPFCAGFENECYANAHWECWGDVIIVRASRDIAAGEEIKISHGPPARYFARRGEMMVIGMWKNFKLCECDLCNQARGIFSLDQVDARFLVLPKLHPFDEDARELLFKLIESDFDLKLTAAAMMILNGAKDPRPKSGLPSPEDGFVWLKISCLLRGRLLKEVHSRSFTRTPDERLNDALTIIRKCIYGLFSLGLKIKGWGEYERDVESGALLVVKDRLPFWDCGIFCLIIAEAYHILCDHPEVDNWMRAAVWLENMTRGGGIPLFRIRYSKILKIMGTFAEESLSRIEKGEPSPRFGGSGPSLRGGPLAGFQSVMHKVRWDEIGGFEVIGGP